jgi:hypothetical protein
MSLSAAKSYSHRPEREERHSARLFKEDRPRRIDQFISFFGDTDDGHERAPEPLDSFAGEPWSER